MEVQNTGREARILLESLKDVISKDEQSIYSPVQAAVEIAPGTCTKTEAIEYIDKLLSLVKALGDAEGMRVAINMPLSFPEQEAQQERFISDVKEKYDAAVNLAPAKKIVTAEG